MRKRRMANQSTAGGLVSSGDPTDPRNADMPLSEIGSVEDGKDARLLERHLKEIEEAGDVNHRSFWDSTTITATSISAAVGAIIGVPIGLYLHSIGF